MNAFRNKSIIILLVGSALLLSACDLDRFFSYDYDADQVASVVGFSGQLTNVFTGEIVDSAQISLNFQSTFSDSSGNFLLDYVLSTDASFNEPVPLLIQADKYFSVDTTLIVLPADNILNVELVYAAPIITWSERVDPGMLRELVPVEAIVFDYQGADNIDSVLVAGKYYDSTYKFHFDFFFPMREVERIDQNTARYRGEMAIEVLNMIPPVPSPSGLEAGSHVIFSRDKDGFEQRTAFTY